MLDERIEVCFWGGVQTDVQTSEDGKKPSTVSAGLLSAGKSSSTSEFKNVRRVIPRRLFHVIKVNQLLNKNHVYVPKEDYDFVYDFIKTRCINAK